MVIEWYVIGGLVAITLSIKWHTINTLTSYILIVIYRVTYIASLFVAHKVKSLHTISDINGDFGRTAKSDTLWVLTIWYQNFHLECLSAFHSIVIFYLNVNSFSGLPGWKCNSLSWLHKIIRWGCKNLYMLIVYNVYVCSVLIIATCSVSTQCMHALQQYVIAKGVINGNHITLTHS